MSELIINISNEKYDDTGTLLSGDWEIYLPWDALHLCVNSDYVDVAAMIEAHYIDKDEGQLKEDPVKVDQVEVAGENVRWKGWFVAE